MKHLFIIGTGAVWTGVALGISAAFGLPSEEAVRVVPTSNRKGSNLTSVIRMDCA